MKIIKLLLLTIILTFPLSGYSQSDSTKGMFNYEFYIDAYYSYDFSNPTDNNRPNFLFQYNKANQIGINMAVARINYQRGKIKANLGINTGVFPQSNMSHEQELLRILYEANIAYDITNKWRFTVGMFSSHMGFESSLSFNNYLTSHSLASEWTPYYLGGAKLEFTPNDKWLLGLTVANGNQMLGEVYGNTNKLIGGQITYSPNDKVTINYSNMYYNDSPDTVMSEYVLYNNLYAIFGLGDKIDLIVGTDYAISDTEKDLYVLSTLLRYRFSEKIALAGRFEHYNDPGNLYISTLSGAGFICQSYSLNFDYSPTKVIKFRIEGRMFNNQDPIFMDYSDPSNFLDVNSNILLSAQVKF